MPAAAERRAGECEDWHLRHIHEGLVQARSDIRRLQLESGAAPVDHGQGSQPKGPSLVGGHPCDLEIEKHDPGYPFGK
jgi:hypothetical protein